MDFIEKISNSRIEEVKSQLWRDKIRLQVAEEEKDEKNIKLYTYRIEKAIEYLAIASK